MVLYFTGTGNSEYAAKRIAQAIDDDCINVFDKIKANDCSEIHSEKPFVIATPTYCWQLPKTLRDWLRKTTLSGSKKIYFAMTCGGEIGNAEKHIKKLCTLKDMEFMGCAEIVMPENYIAMFDAPEKKEALEIINRAEPVIDRIAEAITAGRKIESKPVGIIDKLKSGIVNAFYYPVCVHSKKFTADEKCTGCGKCEKACVLNNIKITDGKPVWGDNCTHCMACICRCPAEAIEYSSISKGKPRYTCPK